MSGTFGLYGILGKSITGLIIASLFFESFCRASSFVSASGTTSTSSAFSLGTLELSIALAALDSSRLTVVIALNTSYHGASVVMERT